MKKWLGFLCLIFSLSAYGEMVDTFPFKHTEDRIRAVELAKSLRCPQCQNQNLVESNSPIAYDLRMEVYKMIDEGKTDEQIIDVMTARFGHFVLYKPPFQWRTALLWGLPFLLLIVALMAMWRYGAKPKGRSVATATETALSDLENTATFLPHEVKPNEVKPNQVNQQSAVKHVRVFVWGMWILLMLVPLLYYFSLNRFDVVKQGEQAFAEKQQQIQTATAHARNDDYIIDIQNKLRKDPNDAQAWIELGQAYVLSNEFENALTAYGNAEKIMGSQPAILGLAATALYYQAGQRITPRIQQLIQIALTQDENETASLSLLASDAFLHTDYANALKYWQKLLDSERSEVDRRQIIESMRMAENLLRAKKTHEELQ